MEDKPLNLRSGYYRVSIKALIIEPDTNKFLLVQDKNSEWDLPGGGLDWGESPQEGLIREIREEMGIEVISVASDPSYFITMERHADTLWTANIIYETSLRDYNFTPTDECIAITFVSKEEAASINISVPVKKFLEVFNPNHK